MKTRLRLIRAVVIPFVLVTGLLYPILSLHLQERIDSAHKAGRALLQAEYEGLVHQINGSLNHVLAMAEFPSLHRYLADAQTTRSPYQAEVFERDQVRLRILLDTWLTHFGAYTRLTLIDRSGEEQLVAGRPERSRTEHGDATWFHKTMALPPRGVYVSSPYVGASLSGPEIRTILIDLAVPVYSESGKSQGVLLLTLDWRKVTSGRPYMVQPDEGVEVLLVNALGFSLLPDGATVAPFGTSFAEQWPEAWGAMADQSRGEVTLSNQTLLFRTHDVRTQHYLSQAEQVIELMETLKAMGIRVALDDFGTGFSSLSYLRDLSTHKVKLDRSFIKDIDNDRRIAAIVQSVITMAHHMDMTVVAEGIETSEQQEDLAKRHCDLLQGYYFARPMPLAALEALSDTLPGSGEH